MEDPSIINSFQTMYLDIVKEHNKYNIEYITAILNKNTFRINDDIILLNDKIKTLLFEMKHSIEQANESISKLDYRVYSDLNEYRRDILKYKSFFLFGKINEEYILYTNNTTKLFPGSSFKNDIIYKTNKKIDDYIFSLINFSGGSKFKKELGTYFKDLIYPLTDLNDYVKYSKLVDSYIENDENSKAIQLCIYYNFLKMEKNNIVLFNEIEILYNYLTLFYDYIGKVVVDDNFMTTIIKMYKENRLQNISYEDFEIIVKDWYKSIRDPEDDPFLGFIQEKDEEV